jgi:uncharacterized protein (TIGR03083 family)
MSALVATVRHMTVDTLDYGEVIRRESARTADALAQASLDARVPSCPDWSASDLAFHLGEVQDFWSQIVQNALPTADDAHDTERRPDDELVPFLRTRTHALLAALAAHETTDACWSWAATGGTVGWVLRRQAHEALVHRVDAEQTAGLPITDPGTALAADGVDEMLGVMVSGLPTWATFTPDGQRVRLQATDAGREWVMAFGRFRGTSPSSGTEYDEPCAELVGGATWDVDAGDVAATVSGTAWDLELWLWGRAGADALECDGDRAAIDRLRAVIVESTQ